MSTEIHNEKNMEINFDNPFYLVNLATIQKMDEKLRSNLKLQLHEGMKDWYLIKHEIFEDIYTGKNKSIERLIFITFKQISCIMKSKVVNGEVVAEPIYKLDEPEYWEAISQLNLVYKCYKND